MTTAARSRDLLRALGYHAEVTEHRRGRVHRVDLFGVADVMAFKPSGAIGWVQAYHRDAIKDHAHLNPKDSEIIRDWLGAGGVYEHHVWHPPRVRPARLGWRCHVIGWDRIGSHIVALVPRWYLANGTTWNPT